MLTQAFMPVPAANSEFSNTTAIAITAANTTVAVAPAGQSSTQWRLFNNGSNVAFINVGNSAANAAAVIPTAGTPAQGMPIAPGAVEVISVPPGATTLGVIGSAAGGTLYITVGEGV